MPTEILLLAVLFPLAAAIYSMAGFGGGSAYIAMLTLVGMATHVADVKLLGTYAPLVIAVLIGGQIGSRLGAWRLPALALRRVTAVVVLFAAFNLLMRATAG